MSGNGKPKGAIEAIDFAARAAAVAPQTPRDVVIQSVTAGDHFVYICFGPDGKFRAACEGIPVTGMGKIAEILLNLAIRMQQQYGAQQGRDPASRIWTP